MSRKPERDEAICAAYQGGKSVADLVTEHGISDQRVRQILKAGGVVMRDDRTASEGLDDFLAINVTDEEKRELREWAEENDTTMAAMSREWIRERLAEIRARKEMAP